MKDLFHAVAARRSQVTLEAKLESMPRLLRQQ